MRLILDRTAQEIEGGAHPGPGNAEPPEHPLPAILVEARLGALAWMRRLADRSRSAQTASRAFGDRVVSLLAQPPASTADVCECPWTQLLGMTSIPEDRAKRLLLVGFAARMGRDDVLLQALRTEPDASVRAAAEAILQARAPG